MIFGTPLVLSKRVSKSPLPSRPSIETSSLAEWTPSTPLTPLDLAQRSFAPSATPPAPSAPFDSLVSSSEEVNTDGSVYSTNADPDAQTASEEEEQLLERPVHGEITLDAALGTTTPVKRKGRNFSAQEDLHLAGAWLDVSQEPVVGDEQTRDEFWGKVHAEFVSRLSMSESDMTENPRVASSLQTRWRSLQAACNKMTGCYAAVYARNESGKTIEDETGDAHALYREQNGSTFKSQAVWSILRHSPKWFESLTTTKGSRKRKGISRDADVVGIAEQAESERPTGKKTAKKAHDTESSLVALVTKLAHETERKNKLLEDATNEQIMARRLDGMSATQQRYYESKQAQILSELEKEFSSSS